MKKHAVYIIVAIDEKWGIGKNGKLPWYLKKDLKHFAKITTETSNSEKENMVIMGRKTWESLPEKYKPLPKRKNIILTRDQNYEAKGAEVYSSLEKAINSADEKIEKIFIIGGGEIFKEAMKYPLDGIFLTKIHKDFDADTFFPNLPESFSKQKHLGSEEEDGTKFDFYHIVKTS